MRYFSSAKGARFNSSLRQRLRFHEANHQPRKLSRLKARFIAASEW
jgi:hypothetical protein